MESHASVQASMDTESPGQHSLLHSIILHLAPGLVFTLFVVIAGTIANARDIDPVFILFGGIGLVLVPLELGYLAVQARRTKGTWSPLAVVEYRERIPTGRLVLLTAGLVVWFLITLIISIAVLDKWLAENLFAWMPDVLLGFALIEEAEGSATGAQVILFLLIALAFNGVAGPVTEELYFRGYLLPRLDRYGRRAPLINTFLFAIYHFFSPWRYPAILIGFLPIAWATWRKRSIYISIAAHVTINLVTVLLILAAALASNS